MFKGFGTSRHVQSRLAALDALRTKVMITDAKLNIIYANPATMALMKDAEAGV